MHTVNSINDPFTREPLNIIKIPAIYHLLNNTKRQIRRKYITITNTLLFSNITSLPSSTNQHQQLTFEEAYSAKTGIRTAALLGGMLLCVVFYLLWKARKGLRFSRLSKSDIDNLCVSTNKFDLDYWLKQVDLFEAKKAERNRGEALPYLELPTEEPRDTQAATASWIVDAWHQWCLIQYRQQHRHLQYRTSEQLESNSISYRNQHNLLPQFLRRLLVPSQQRLSLLNEHLSSLIASFRSNIPNNNMAPLRKISGIQLRRATSWPRLQSTHHPQSDTMMDASQVRYSRKCLLKRESRFVTFNI